MYFDKASLSNINQPIYILPGYEQPTLATRWPVRVVRVYICYTCYKVRIISIVKKNNMVCHSKRNSFT